MGAPAFFVVDDNAPFASALARLLSPLGESSVASTVAEAKALIERHEKPWAAMIIDVSLPDGSGLDVLDFARAAGCASPALVLTVSHDPGTINRAFVRGARFMVKSGEWGPIESFVKSALSVEGRFDDIASQWARLYDLSRTELAILVATAKGASREQIVEDLDIVHVTLKRHIANMLKKTRDESLLHATTRLLREAALESHPNVALGNGGPGFAKR